MPDSTQSQQIFQIMDQIMSRINHSIIPDLQNTAEWLTEASALSERLVTAVMEGTLSPPELITNIALFKSLLDYNRSVYCHHFPTDYLPGRRRPLTLSDSVATDLERLNENIAAAVQELSTRLASSFALDSGSASNSSRPLTLYDLIARDSKRLDQNTAGAPQEPSTSSASSFGLDLNSGSNSNLDSDSKSNVSTEVLPTKSSMLKVAFETLLDSWRISDYEEDLPVEDDQCAVCLETLNNSCPLIRLPCHDSHILHRECVIDSMVTGGSDACPLCRAPFLEEMTSILPDIFE